MAPRRVGHHPREPRHPATEHPSKDEGLGELDERDFQYATPEPSETEVTGQPDPPISSEKEEDEREIFDMAGSGFESTVRLAKSSPEMWTPIFEQNKANVIETLEEYIQNLNHFKALMESDDFEAIRSDMENTNYIKTILKGIS